jgi:transcriptional regulator of heat shock response
MEKGVINQLDERAGDILHFVVRDFVHTAQPVSSDRIYKKYRLGVSPATIRNILCDLEESGFLEKPHTSAGRVPTDKGYRHLVNGILRKEQQSNTIKKEYIPRDIVRDLSKKLNLFVGAITDEEEEYAGFHAILKEPEFQIDDMARNFGALVDDFENVVATYEEELARHAPEQYYVWIGRENLLRNAMGGSTVVARIEHGAVEGSLTLFAYGPRRMDYERTISTIEQLLNDV